MYFGIVVSEFLAWSAYSAEVAGENWPVLINCEKHL